MTGIRGLKRLSKHAENAGNYHREEPKADQFSSILEADTEGVEFVYRGKYDEERQRVRDLEDVYVVEQAHSKVSPNNRNHAAAIGIAFSDLNDDGRDEVLAVLVDAGYGMSRCNFGDYNREDRGTWGNLLKVLTPEEGIRIVSTTNPGYRDFRFGGRCFPFRQECTSENIWKFTGKQYKHFSRIEIDTDAAAGVEIITKPITPNFYELPEFPERIVDIK